METVSVESYESDNEASRDEESKDEASKDEANRDETSKDEEIIYNKGDSQAENQKIKLTVLDDKNQTVGEFVAEEWESPFSPKSNCSYTSDSASLSHEEKFVRPLKRSSLNPSMQKSKKKKSESSESETFFQGLGSALTYASNLTQNKSQSNVSDELVVLIKQLLDRHADLLDSNDETDLFLRSLKSSLNHFKNDRKVYEIVKFRLQKVIIDAMEEFEKNL